MAGGCCGQGGGRTTTYTLTTNDGRTLGPYLTETEARVARTQEGGGTITAQST